MSGILRKKLTTIQVQSAAAAAEVKFGPTIPQGMKLYVTRFHAWNEGATATVLNVYSGIAGTKTQTTKISKMPVLANNAAGAQDGKLEGSIDNPVLVVEPGMAAGVRSNTELYLGDGGQRVNCFMEYYLDY